MTTTTIAAVPTAALARGRPASSLAASQPLTAPTFPRWKGPARHLSSRLGLAAAVVLALLAALVAPGFASGLDAGRADLASRVAAAPAEAHPGLDAAGLETRVRASSQADGTRVGVETAVGGILHPGSAQFYDQVVSGWLVAPRLTDDALRAADDAFGHGYRYDPRIRARGLQDPVGHNFPYSYDDVILQSNPIRQADGSLLYRTPGSTNSKDGFFEIAVNPDTGTIFHRTFVGGR